MSVLSDNMQNINMPTSWPLPPTSTPASRLRQELKVLKHEIADLIESNETAANRIALVLERLRSGDEIGANTSENAVSHRSDLGETMRDHPFARFSFHDIAHMDSLPAVDVRDESKHESCPFPRSENNAAKQGMAADAADPNTSLSIARTDASPECELSSTFLSITASLKDEVLRASQCEIVEVSTFVPRCKSRPSVMTDLPKNGAISTCVASLCWKLEEDSDSHAADQAIDVDTCLSVGCTPDHCLHALSQSR